MLKFSRLLPNEIKQQKFETELKFYSSILGVISTSSVFRHVLNVLGVPVFFASFTIEMIRNETGLVLKIVDLSRK